MKPGIILLVIVHLVSGCLKAQHPVQQEPVLLADPAILLHNGTYYLYGTGGNSDHGFMVYTSSDLKHWEGPKGVSAGYALKKGDAFGDKGFWAPQVFVSNGKFYMAYTANENIALAESESPLGPFKQQEKKALPSPVKQIDPFVFTDDDGKTYLYHVRLQNGNRIFVAQMTDDLSAIKPETLKECISATQPWENTQQAGWPVAEGPTLIKHNKLYYLLYSANDFRNPDYAVGYAVSNFPSGPFTRYQQNPIISRQVLGVPGTGHGDIFNTKDGKLGYVFHGHQSDSTVSPRKTAMVTIDFVDTPGGGRSIGIQKQSFRFLTHPAQAGN